VTTVAPVVEDFPFLAQMTATIKNEVANAAMFGGQNDFVMGLMDRILNATDADEIFAAQESGLLAGKDFANRPFVIMDRDAIEWRDSGQANIEQGGYLYYAIIKVIPLDTGEETVIACGGKTFVATLYQLREVGYFDDQPDGRTMIITATQSPNGAYLQLRPVKRAEPARAKK